MATLIRASYPEPAMVFVGPGDPMPTAKAAVGDTVKPKGSTFTLEEMYEYVGSPIDIQRLPDGSLVVLNDDGKGNGLPVNVEATIRWRDAWRGVSDWAAADTIVGDVLICDATEVD